MTTETPIIEDPWTADELLREALKALNTIPSHTLYGDRFKTSYALAAAISKYLKGLRND